MDLLKEIDRQAVEIINLRKVIKYLQREYSDRGKEILFYRKQLELKQKGKEVDENGRL